MMKTNVIIASQLESRLNQYLRQFEEIRMHVEDAGLTDSPEWTGALHLVRARTEELRFHLRYLKVHDEAILQKMLKVHIYGLLTDLNSLIRELSQEYK